MTAAVGEIKHHKYRQDRNGGGLNNRLAIDNLLASDHISLSLCLDPVLKYNEEEAISSESSVIMYTLPLACLLSMGLFVITVASSNQKTITIATFNIQNLGPTKMTKPEVVQHLKQVAAFCVRLLSRM